MRNGSTGGAYFAHVDGLRAVAVLAVIFYHLDAGWLPGGFTGVDIFFVISGFVVSASVDRLPRNDLRTELLRFYERRMRRIAPALIVCLLATAVLTALFIPESWLSEASRKTGRMAFFGLSNWKLAATGNDYFSLRAEFNPYTHTWSLGVEEQFYLLFPLLFLAWRRGGAGRGVSLALFALATAASLGWAMVRMGNGGGAAAFYLTTTRFWQLGAGVLLYQLLAVSRDREGGRLFDTGLALPRVIQAPLPWLGAAVIGYGLLAARPGHSPWTDGLWPVAGTVLLLASLHRRPGGWVARALSLAPVVAIGRLSYSLYLWHWPVLVVLRWTVGLESLAVKLPALVLVFALAAASYRWVEIPWRHRRFAGWGSGRVVSLGLAALVLGAGLQSLLVKATPHLSLSTVSRHPLDWYAYARGLREELPGCRLQRNVERVGMLEAWVFSRADPCDLPGGTERQVFVVGDSHGIAYNELLQRYAVQDGERVRLYGVGGCAVAPVQAWQGPDPGCQAFMAAALDDVAARARPGDVLFLPGLRLHRFADQDELFDRQAIFAATRSPEADRGREAVVADAVARLAPIAASGVNVLLEAPKPLLPAPPYRCSDWFNQANPVCVHGLTVNRADMEEYREPALRSLQAIAARLPNTTVWDPLPLLCDARECGPGHDGHPLFFDADHLSGYGNRLLLPEFREQLRRLPAGG